MSDDVDTLKQTEKEKMAGWEMEFAAESDVAEFKAEKEDAPGKDRGETWQTWLAWMLIVFGLLALFGFHVGFGWWWVFIFLGPWLWRGGCGRKCGW